MTAILGERSGGFLGLIPPRLNTAVRSIYMKKKKLESAREIRRWASAAGTKSKYILAKRIERDAKKLDEVENPRDFFKDINVNFNSRSLHNCTILVLFIKNRFSTAPCALLRWSFFMKPTYISFPYHAPRYPMVFTMV